MNIKNNIGSCSIKIDVFSIGSMTNRTTKPIIGIYKITSPDGKIYVGKSRDVERRFVDYKLLNSVSPELNKSFIEHGVKNHVFEIIHVCKKENGLSELETKYIDEFDCVYPKGFNKHNVGSGGRPTKEESLIRINGSLTKEVYELRNLNNELNKIYGGEIDFRNKLINKIDDKIKSLHERDAEGHLWYNKLKELVLNTK